AARGCGADRVARPRLAKGVGPLAFSPLAFSGDGKRLALAAGAVQVWDLGVAGRQVMSLKGASAPLALNHDGTRLASTSWGRREVSVWDLTLPGPPRRPSAPPPPLSPVIGAWPSAPTAATWLVSPGIKIITPPEP